MARARVKPLSPVAPSPRPSLSAARPGAERECVCAGLLTPAFYAGPATPAEEFPNLRVVCDAGLAAVVEHSARWLERAGAYQLQAADGNAGVIATQLCAARRFLELACLGGDAAGAAELAALLEQACALAALVGRGGGAANMLASTDVGSLKFGQYMDTVKRATDYTQAVLDRKAALAGQADLRAVLAREGAAGAADDRAEQGLWQGRANQDAARMAQHKCGVPRV